MGGERPENQNENTNSIINRRTVAIFAAVVCAILLITRADAVKNLFAWVTDTLAPIFLGVIFAYIISPVDSFVEKRLLKALEKNAKMRPDGKKRLARGIGVTTAILFLLAIIALLIFLIIPEFIVSLKTLVDIAPDLVSKAGDRLNSLIVEENTFTQHLGGAIDDVISALTSWFGNEFSGLVGSLAKGVISVATFVMNFLISLVVCVYALIERDQFRSQSKKLLYACFKRERANDILHIARYGNDIFGKFISGKLITSSIVGILTFTFMTIMGMDYALLSAGILAMTNVIPFFGPFIGGIPTALIVLLTNPRHGVIYIIFMLVLQQVEGNIIEPVIMEDQTGISKFWVTFALLFCGGVFGIAGMIFSVPLFAVIFYTIKMAVERSLRRKGLPIPSEEYYNVGFIHPETGERLAPPARNKQKRIRDAIQDWRERVTNKKRSDETENAEGLENGDDKNEE